MTNIELLMAQIEALKPKPIEPKEEVITLTISELDKRIEEGIRKALEPKELTLEDVLSKIFSTEDLAYFTNPDNFKRLPKFLLTESGKSQITSLFTSFKEFKCP